MDYYKFISRHMDLLLNATRTRYPGESLDNWLRAQRNSENELRNLEEKYPEYTQKILGRIKTITEDEH